MIFRGSSLLLANNKQWNLLKIFLENFRKAVYGFEEVCFAEVLYGKMTKFFTSDFSMNFFYSISWRIGAIAIHFKGFWRTSANFRNFRKLPRNRSTALNLSKIVRKKQFRWKTVCMLQKCVEKYKNIDILKGHVPFNPGWVLSIFRNIRTCFMK